MIRPVGLAATPKRTALANLRTTGLTGKKVGNDPAYVNGWFSALRYGKIARMAGPASDPEGPASDPKSLLREDLSKEYYAILDVVSNYDGWLLIVKGWSVTLSLVALGLGFQQRHYALFFLAAVTGAAFWLLDGLMKGYQYRYYVRMREIEYTAYLINRVTLGGLYGEKEISAPRIDMTWGFQGFPVDDELKPLSPTPTWRRRVRRKLGPPPPEPRHPRRPQESEDPDYRASEPWRREPEEVYWDLRHRFEWANVVLPHGLAVVLGLLFFIIAAALNAAGVDHLRL